MRGHVIELATFVLCASLLSGCNAPADTSVESLTRAWETYRGHYLSTEGYVVDPLRQGQVTSEAQSYALLQAAWLRDRASFETVLAWTDAHLRRPDGLYSWLWDPSTGAVVDANSATDADTDIAFALVVAAAAFDRPAYRDRARALAVAIRTGEAIQTPRGWFPSAGNWAQPERVINLSYFTPYAYSAFETLDPGAGWDQAIVLGYALLDEATNHDGARLPGDFATLDANGRLRPLPPGSRQSGDFSYDAIRIAWRVEIDCQLRHEARACAGLPFVGRLAALYARDGRLVTRYTPAGEPAAQDVSSSVYGALLPAMHRVDRTIGARWETSVLSSRELSRLRAAHDRYYDANWTWFGLAGASGLIRDRTPAH